MSSPGAGEDEGKETARLRASCASPQGSRRPPEPSFHPLSSTLPPPPPTTPRPRPNLTPAAGKTLLKVTLHLDSSVWKAAPTPATQPTLGAWHSQGPEGLGEAAGENEESNALGPENWDPGLSSQYCAILGKSRNLSVSSSDHWQADRWWLNALHQYTSEATAQKDSCDSSPGGFLGLEQGREMAPGEASRCYQRRQAKAKQRCGHVCCFGLILALPLTVVPHVSRGRGLSPCSLNIEGNYAKMGRICRFSLERSYIVLQLLKP